MCCADIGYTTDSWFRFLVKHIDRDAVEDGKRYWWDEMSFFIHQSTGSMVAFCVDVPVDFPTVLKSTLNGSSDIPGSAEVHNLEDAIISQVIDRYEQSVWA